MHKYKDNLIEQMNKDYIKICNSKEYRIGRFICNLIDNIKNKELDKIKQKMRLPLNYMRLKKCSGKESRFFEKKDIEIKEKIAVYTAVYGKYDEIRNPMSVDFNCDYYIFTDEELPSNSVWKKVEYHFGEKISSQDRNRFIKMKPHVFFPEYRFSIYIDGNIQIYGKLSKFLKYLNEETGIAMFNHPSRGCIYSEGEACIILKKTNPNKIRHQLRRYHNENMPSNYGMCECNVIVREHHNKLCQVIMNNWWDEYRISESKRDQLSLPYVLWKMGISIDKIGCLGENINECTSFRRMEHLK